MGTEGHRELPPPLPPVASTALRGARLMEEGALDPQALEPLEGRGHKKTPEPAMPEAVPGPELVLTGPGERAHSSPRRAPGQGL